jgi:hypothetical protein
MKIIIYNYYLSPTEIYTMDFFSTHSVVFFLTLAVIIKMFPKIMVS